MSNPNAESNEPLQQSETQQTLQTWSVTYKHLQIKKCVNSETTITREVKAQDQHAALVFAENAEPICPGCDSHYRLQRNTLKLVK